MIFTGKVAIIRKYNLWYLSFSSKIYIRKTNKKNKRRFYIICSSALFSLLNDNDITCAIEKENDNINVSLTTLQLISSGEAFRKVI